MKNKKNILLILFLLISFGVGTYYFIEFEGTKQKITQISINSITELPFDSTFTRSIDFTSDVIRFNNDNTLSLDVNFKEGHIEQGKLEGYLTKNTNGYTIKLKSQTPITTPTIADNYLYVSGGFGSKSYFCFEINDGRLVWAIDLDDDGPSSSVISDSLQFLIIRTT